MPKIDLRGKLYLFHQDRGIREDLAITSHGAQLPLRVFKSGYGRFRVPAGVTLYFYAPDGESLDDPAISSVITGKVPSYQEIKSGEYTNDYLLVKYELDTYSKLQYSNKQDNTIMDILTVRNRLHTKLGIKLSEVLRMLSASGYRYKRIHCIFCRTSLSGFLRGRSYDPFNPHTGGVSK